MGAADDAGAFALGDGRALIQTVDIFTPVVDSPADWGRIAAANALSDVYAMGGKPLTALQYLAWPRDVLRFELAAEVIAGGMDVMASASCTVVGGHSIDGPEPTFGFAVTGVVDVGDIVTNAGASVGELLVLTKPIGLGIITTGIKNGTCPEPVADEAVSVMTSLNDVAGASLRPNRASAATDVTGFGLLGHLREMLIASGVGAQVDYAKVPVIEGTVELLEAGMYPGGSKRNLASLRDFVGAAPGESELRILADAQTSGGLLAALPKDGVEGYLRTVPGSTVIGRLVPQLGIEVL